jgi:pimeloyl-ACP methyl ester carboxylesterase
MTVQDHPVRRSFTVDGRRLSFLDFGGTGPALLALHGHFNEASAFTGLARDLAGRWRVLALDQRGHGESDRADSYGRAGYLADLAAWWEQLDLGPVPVLGHSLGGVNAYQFAARYPERVSALVVEDIGAVCDVDTGFATRLPRAAPTRDALEAALGPVAPYLACAFRERAEGWGYSFDVEDTVASQRALTGDHWADWLAVRCPTLLVHGSRSDELTTAHAREMVRRRGGTATLAELAAGHVVHQDAAAEFADVVAGFLAAEATGRQRLSAPGPAACRPR